MSTLMDSSAPLHPELPLPILLVATAIWSMIIYITYGQVHLDDDSVLLVITFATMAVTVQSTGKCSPPDSPCKQGASAFPLSR
jgi:hypothetical protein